MNPEDVVELYSLLTEHDVYAWVDGGWGIDALLGKQTRPHKDLDLMVRHDDLAILTQTLAPRGFTLKNIWDENRWTGFPAPALLIARQDATLEIATAFVLKDALGREIDVHAFAFDERGYGTPCWNTRSYARALYVGTVADVDSHGLRAPGQRLSRYPSAPRAIRYRLSAGTFRGFQ